MARKQYRFWVSNEKLKEFLDSKGSRAKHDFSDFARDIFTLVMENKLDKETIQDLQKRKLLADIQYKEVMTEIKKKELGYMKNFESPPSHAAKNAIREGEMQSVQAISFYDEKNWRFQCPECGILFVFKSVETRQMKKTEFVDHFMASHRIFTKEEQEELAKL